MVENYLLKHAVNIIRSNNITYTEFTPFYQPNYQIVNNIWKSYRFLNKFPLQLNSILKFFKFHLDSTVDHGIMYYANNSDNALILFKISNTFFSSLIPANHLTNKNKNFIAIYTNTGPEFSSTR